jgi:YidC/Oxa1 family membrane protein insertase
MMKLYKDTGTNPFSSCLPLLLQSPIFLALFRVLDRASHGEGLSGHHRPPRGLAPPREDLRRRDLAVLPPRVRLRREQRQVVAIVLIILMTATMFITQCS